MHVGTASAIATGGAVPRGADAVVMIEHTGLIETPKGPAIDVRRAATPGQFVAFGAEQFRHIPDGRRFGLDLLPVAPTAALRIEIGKSRTLTLPQTSKLRHARMSDAPAGSETEITQAGMIQRAGTATIPMVLPR